jgi:hypothetical protein
MERFAQRLSLKQNALAGLREDWSPDQAGRLYQNTTNATSSAIITKTPPILFSKSFFDIEFLLAGFLASLYLR